MTSYEVIVDNIGVVYHGTNGFEARRVYQTYVGVVREQWGRAGARVTLMREDEIVDEYWRVESADGAS